MKIEIAFIFPAGEGCWMKNNKNGIGNKFGDPKVGQKKEGFTR